jgi:hypothetical protein
MATLQTATIPSTTLAAIARTPTRLAGLFRTDDGELTILLCTRRPPEAPVPGELMPVSGGIDLDARELLFRRGSTGRDEFRILNETPGRARPRK